MFRRAARGLLQSSLIVVQGCQAIDQILVVYLSKAIVHGQLALGLPSQDTLVPADGTLIVPEVFATNLSDLVGGIVNLVGTGIVTYQMLEGLYSQLGLI